MREIIHHFKYEYKTNSKILCFSFIILLVFMFPFTLTNEARDVFMLICFPMMVGWALGLSSKKDFCLKYYLSLPMARDQMLLCLLVGRSLYFFPTLFIFVIYYKSIPKDEYFNLNFPIFVVMFFIVQFILNLVQLLSDIESPRIENVSSKFEAFLMFVKKNFIYNFVYGTLILYGGVLFIALLKVSPFSFVANQFAVTIYLAIIFYLFFHKCYKHLVEEHRTYWNWKTDGALSCVLGVLVLAPTFFFLYSPRVEKFAAMGPINKDISLKKYDSLKEGLDKETANRSNTYGITPMAAAIIFDDRDAFSYLVEGGARPQDRVRAGQLKGFVLGANELMIAVAMDRYFFVEKLLNMRSDPNALHEISGDTPLHISTSRCYPTVTKLLLDYGAEVDVQNKLKKTPLHYAVSNKCYSSLLLLVGHGADTEIEDRNRKSPLDYAKKTKIRYFLENKDAFVRGVASDR